jgi:hypothetical protein
MMSVLLSKAFWVDAAERSLKSFAQGCTFALLQGAAPSDKLNLFDASFANVVGIGGGMAVLSLLTSIASAPVRGTVSPASMAMGALPPPTGAGSPGG